MRYGEFRSRQNHMINYARIIMIGSLAAGFLAGCSSSDPLSGEDSGADDDAVLEQSYGAVTAEFSYPRSGDEKGVDVQAQFVDARGVAIAPALEALEVWMPQSGLETGACRFLHYGADEGTDDAPALLHLHDIGDIDVESPKEQITVEPTRLPDLLGSFYGVVYSTEWSDDRSDGFLEYYPDGEYRFQAPGSEKAGALDVELQSPDPVVLMAANGQRIRDETTMAIDVDDELELVWTSEGGIDGGDEVYIDLSTGYGPEHARVQCRARDLGAFSVPRSELRELSRLGDRIDLELRRVRRGETSVDGLEHVDVHFATTDRITLEVE